MAEDNVNEILGIEETTKEVAEKPVKSEEINNSAENTLVVIGNIVLAAGILVGVICLFTICWVDSGKYHYSTDIVFNPTGFAMTVGIILSSLLTWAVLKVVANISKTLKEINSKIK